MPGRTISEDRGTLGSLLRAPYEKLQAHIYAQLEARGFGDIRPAHSSVFRYILPEGSRVSDLADRANMTKQSMAYLVQSLESLGYAAVVPDETDKRAKLVVLTDKGRAVWEMLVTLSEETEARAASAIGRDHVDALRAALKALSAAIDGF